MEMHQLEIRELNSSWLCFCKHARRKFSSLPILIEYSYMRLFIALSMQIYNLLVLFEQMLPKQN